MTSKTLFIYIILFIWVGERGSESWKQEFVLSPSYILTSIKTLLVPHAYYYFTFDESDVF